VNETGRMVRGMLLAAGLWVEPGWKEIDPEEVEGVEEFEVPPARVAAVCESSRDVETEGVSQHREGGACWATQPAD